MEIKKISDLDYLLEVIDEEKVKTFLKKKGLFEVFYNPENNFIEQYFKTDDFEKTKHIINIINATSEKLDHHPIVNYTYGMVHIKLHTNDHSAVTKKDLKYILVLNELINRLD